MPFTEQMPHGLQRSGAGACGANSSVVQELCMCWVIVWMDVLEYFQDYNRNRTATVSKKYVFL